MKYRARLFVVNPLHTTTFFPNAVIQGDPEDPSTTDDDRKVRLIGHDWAITLPHPCLEQVTAEDLRVAMKLPISVPLFLTEARVLPDHDWISRETLKWAENWQNEVVAEWKESHLARAS